MNAIVEITPEAQAEVASVDTMLTWANQMQVATHAEYEKAGEGLKRIKAKAKTLDDLRKSLTKPLDDAKTKLMDIFRSPKEKLDLAEAAIKRTMIGFQEEQDKIRREAERQAAEAARKERERLEREAAQIAQKAREARDAAEAKAAAMEAAGNAERAAAMRQAAEEKEAAKLAQSEALQMASQSMPLAPVIDMPRAESAGTSIREIWRYEISDAAQIPRQYLIPDDKAIGAVVRALKDRASIPGIRVWAEKTMSSRSA